MPVLDVAVHQVRRYVETIGELDQTGAASGKLA